MTTAQADPVRAAIPDASEDNVETHLYRWYDPDAADYDLADPLADVDALSDEDAVTNFG